jgi:hypothetical protein
VGLNSSKNQQGTVVVGCIGDTVEPVLEAPVDKNVEPLICNSNAVALDSKVGISNDMVVDDAPLGDNIGTGNNVQNLVVLPVPLIASISPRLMHVPPKVYGPKLQRRKATARRTLCDDETGVRHEKKMRTGVPTMENTTSVLGNTGSPPPTCENLHRMPGNQEELLEVLLDEVRLIYCCTRGVGTTEEGVGW